MRAFFYWLTVTAIAVLAARASDDVLKEAPAGWFWPTGAQVNALPVPEPSRAVLLGLGILAIAFTYRRAWLNMKRKG